MPIKVYIYPRETEYSILCFIGVWKNTWQYSMFFLQNFMLIFHPSLDHPIYSSVYQSLSPLHSFIYHYSSLSVGIHPFIHSFLYPRHMHLFIPLSLITFIYSFLYSSSHSFLHSFIPHHIHLFIPLSLIKFIYAFLYP